jgi:hypothetical protein
MRTTKRNLALSVDIMESRLLLSTVAPLVSEHALNGLVRDVKVIMSTLARTENTVQASARLTNLSSRIPSGPEELAPSWQGDIAFYRPHSARSIVATERLILDDLDLYVEDGSDGDNLPVTGPGYTTSTTSGQGTGTSTTSGQGTGTSTTSGQGTGTSTTSGQGTGSTATPAPSSSLDSVTVENTTGLALLVTVRLDVPQVQQPYITETISAQSGSIATFDFGTATDAFMTMDVSLADGAQSPPPLTDLSLPQPMSGYNGTLFSISLIGPYFNVTPL